MRKVQSMTSADLITRDEAAQTLGCSPRTVARYVDAGRLTAYRTQPGNRLMLSRGEVDALAKPVQQ